MGNSIPHVVTDIAKQVPNLVVLAFIVWIFIGEADANTALLTDAIQNFGTQVEQMHAQMIATHVECHVIQKHSVSALEKDAAARREQTRVMESLRDEIRRHMVQSGTR